MSLTLLDLPTLEYAFSQQALLTADQFVKEATRRGHPITLGHLEAYHRTGVLIPVFRAKRMPWPVNHGQGHSGLLPMHGAGLLVDPRSEPFRPWSRYFELGRHWTWSSRWVYSPYQLLALHRIDRLMTLGKPRFAKWAGAHYPWATRVGSGEIVEPLLIVALTSVERRYLPALQQSLHLPIGGSQPWNLKAEEYDNWARHWNAPEELIRLGCDAARILDAARHLLIEAGFDPLRKWLPVVRQATFKAWDSLAGDARLAIDFRLAAELLLRFYSDLTKAHVAPPLPEIPGMVSDPLAERLVRDRATLDADLTDFGLSPHPVLILVLEGKSEMVLIPAAMRAAGFTISRNGIQVIDGQGTTRDFTPFIVPMAAPDVTAFSGDPDYVMLTRPPTRVLVATDPEGSFSDAKREKTRRSYVTAIATAMEKTQGVETPEDELDTLVSTFTWGRFCMEYSCFTDLELASAITRLKRAGDAPVTVAEVAAARSSDDPNGRLRSLLDRGTTVKKPDLALALVPLVELEVRTALERNTLADTPIGRLLIKIEEEALKSRPERMIMRGKIGPARLVTGPVVS
jgi:hypothetical protein